MFANTLIFSPWLFRFLAVTVLLGQWPNHSVVLGALLSAGSLTWALPRLRVLLSEGHRYAAITPRGLQARTPKNTYLIPWADLAEITIVLGVPRIKRCSTPTVCELDWIFDTDREVRDFSRRSNGNVVASPPRRGALPPHHPSECNDHTTAYDKPELLVRLSSYYQAIAGELLDVQLGPLLVSHQ